MIGAGFMGDGLVDSRIKDLAFGLNRGDTDTG
jgi:hypothetical protein